MDVAATKINGVMAVVDYEYKAQETDELDLEKGDIIHSIKKMPGGWWQGTLQSNGKSGMFPDNFVRVIDTNDESTVLLRDKSATVNRRCKVVFSYTQVNDDELTLSVGDVIEFLGEVEEGWWRGRLNTKVGVFPSNFVVSIEPSPVFASKRLPSTIVKNNGNNIAGVNVQQQSTVAPGTVGPTVTSTSVTSQSTKSKTNRLSMHSSKEDLLNTNTNGSSTLSGPLPATVATDDVPHLPPKPPREYCRVEFPYGPQNEDELELKVGDIITIISMDLPDKGWWKGELRGRVGVFPDNFVKLIPSTDDFDLERALAANENFGSRMANFFINTIFAPLNDTQPSHRTAKIVMNSGAATNSLGLGTATTNFNTSSTTNMTNSSSSTASTTSKVLIRKTGTSTTGTTQQTSTTTNRKESFGSRDSLNDILSETGLPTGNVAAQRKSLENKNLDLSHPPMGIKKLQQQHQQETKSTSATTTIINNAGSITSSTTSVNAGSSSVTTSELRKSLENLDDKTKTTPPPVLTKKPTVPSKKSSSVTSVAGNLFSGLKQKVKNVENKLTTAASHDLADGIGGSKLSPSGGLPESGAPGGFGAIRRANTIAVEDSEFDSVERASILTDVRANRVKAPKRRPPSAAINVIGESNNNSSMYLNGAVSLDSGGISTTEESKVQSSDENSTGDEHLAKPKPREWEKKKAPWMEELKASQVKKKTSPNVDPPVVSSERTASTTSSINNISNNLSTSTSSNIVTSSTSSSSSTSTKVQSSTISSSIIQQSANVESSSGNGSPTRIQFYKKDSSNSGSLDVMSKSLSAKLATDSSSVNEELRSTRPNSLSISNRSISPSLNSNRSSGRTGGSTMEPNSSANITNNTTVTKTAATSSTSSTILNNMNHSNEVISNNIVATSNGTSSSVNSNTNKHQNSINNTSSNARVIELEKRVDKLENVVQSQQRMIDELIRSLREETDRVKLLRGELDKYAQCVTQV